MLTTISLILNGVLLLVLILTYATKTFKTKLTNLIIEAEKTIPGKTGNEKLQYVLGLIKNSSFIAKIFKTSFLINIINKIVESLNDFAK